MIIYNRKESQIQYSDSSKRNLGIVTLYLFFLLLGWNQNVNAESIIVLIDSKFLVTDTLDFESDGKWLAGMVDVKNFTGKKDRSHTWLFSSNVTLNASVKKSSTIDSDLNAIRMKNYFEDLYMQVKPDFTKPAMFSIKAALSSDTVYRAILNYPILKFYLNINNEQEFISHDTTISAWVENVGLSTLKTRIKVESDAFECVHDSLVTVAPLSKQKISLTFFRNSNQESKYPITIKAINIEIPENFVEEKVSVISTITTSPSKKEARSHYWIWLLLIIGILTFKYWKKIPFVKSKKENLVFPLEIEKAKQALDKLQEHYTKNGVDDFDDAFEFFVESIQAIKPKVVIEPSNTRKVKVKKVPSEFKRIDIVQRASFKRLINDQGLHERLGALSEVDLIKYIGAKFKDSVTLQKIIGLDDELTRANAYANVQSMKKKLDALEKGKQPKVMTKTSPIKIEAKVVKPKVEIKKEKEKFRYEKSDEYYLLLTKLHRLLLNVGALEWENSLPLVLLKNKFLGYLGIKEDRLGQYIVLVEKKGIPKNRMSEEDLNRFIHLFTDVYNVSSFSKLAAFRKEFVKISFPFSAYNEVLSELEKLWKQKMDLELIIPEIFIEAYKPDIHSNSDDVSKILAENAIEIEDQLAPGVIKDYSSLGVVSKKLQINKKAMVYTSR